MGSEISGGASPARLLRRLPRPLLPAFAALGCSLGQMSLRAAGNQGNDARGAQLGALLNRPGHVVKLENRKNDRDGPGGS